MPSQTCSSHSGTERSSGTLTIWPTSRSSSRSDPGGGTATRKMCRPGSSSLSEIHIGWLRRSGSIRARLRNDGSLSRRAMTSPTNASKSKPPGRSRIATLTVCMCMVGVSR
jgi:hypothetical protein